MSGPGEIRDALQRRRTIRALVVFGFYASVALGVGLWIWGAHPLVQSRAYLAALLILGGGTIAGAHYLKVSDCPRCGKPYAEKAGGRHRNAYTSECLNCGLRIDGANASQN